MLRRHHGLTTDRSHPSDRSVKGETRFVGVTLLMLPRISSTVLWLAFIDEDVMGPPRSERLCISRR